MRKLGSPAVFETRIHRGYDTLETHVRHYLDIQFDGQLWEPYRERRELMNDLLDSPVAQPLGRPIGWRMQVEWWDVLKHCDRRQPHIPSLHLRMTMGLSRRVIPL